jgi:hypothetical protein
MGSPVRMADASPWRAAFTGVVDEPVDRPERAGPGRRSGPRPGGRRKWGVGSLAGVGRVKAAIEVPISLHDLRSIMLKGAQTLVHAAAR